MHLHRHDRSRPSPLLAFLVLLTSPVLLAAACGTSDAPAFGAAAEPGAPSPLAALGSGNPGSGSGNTVLGTIRATIDGEAHTWYVVAGTVNGQPASGGLWMGDTPGERMVVAAGYDTPDPPFDEFERGPDGMPISTGSYQGSMISVHVSEEDGPFPMTLRFPTEFGAAAVGVMYQRRIVVEDVLDHTHMLAEGSIEVTTLSIEGGEAHIEGTFAGTMLRSMHTLDPIHVTDGRFEMRGLPHLSTLTP